MHRNAQNDGHFFYDDEGCYLIATQGACILLPMFGALPQVIFFVLIAFGLLHQFVLFPSVVHLWSLQAFPKVYLKTDEIEALTKCTKNGGTKVMQVKASKGFAILSMV